MKECNIKTFDSKSNYQIELYNDWLEDRIKSIDKRINILESFTNNTSKVKTYTKKPIDVEAIQWSGNANKMLVEQFVGKKLDSELESETAYLAGKGAPRFNLLIETKEGVMKASPGDWIIKEAFPTGDRDFYPCKDSIFKNTYVLKK